MRIFEDKTKMPKAGDSATDSFVTAALAQPEASDTAPVPGLCKEDNHVQHARIPSVGKN